MIAKKEFRKQTYQLLFDLIANNGAITRSDVNKMLTNDNILDEFYNKLNHPQKEDEKKLEIAK